jgi:hypothetical protein
MDGTGKFFESFLRALPSHLVPRVVSYPTNEALGYRALEPFVETSFPKDGPFAILAESFSGPLPLRLAASAPAGFVGVILVASLRTETNATRIAILGAVTRNLSCQAYP